MAHLGNINCIITLSVLIYLPCDISCRNIVKLFICFCFHDLCTVGNVCICLLLDI